MDEKFDAVLCMAIKIKPVHTISHKLMESMPWILPSLSSLFLLILLLLSMLTLLQFSLPSSCVCFYYFAHGTNNLKLFRVFTKQSDFFIVSKTIKNTPNFLYIIYILFGLTKIPLFILYKKIIKNKMKVLDLQLVFFYRKKLW